MISRYPVFIKLTSRSQDRSVLSLISPFILLVIITIVLSSCNTTYPLSKNDQISIKKIYVSKLIIRDADPSLLRLDVFSFDALVQGGDFIRYYDAKIPQGYMEIYDREKNYLSALSNHFETNQIRIDHILYDSFISAWQRRDLIPLKPSFEPDAIIKLELVNYGMLVKAVNHHHNTGFMVYPDSGVAPYMMVKATVIDSSNQIIWQQEVEYELFLVGPQNHLKLQQWISRPSHLREAFKKVASIVSESIIEIIPDDFKK